MSGNNPSIVRETLERLNRGDPVDDLISPDVAWEVRVGPEQGEFRGFDAVTEYYRRYFGTWDEFHVEIEELRDLPGDKVLVAAWDVGRGKGSGAQVQMRVFQIWTLMDGEVVRWQGFATRAEALEAAGVRA